ncbi:hypothetical protein BKH46_09310 [Helicobacter sp. 12S02634-8]|uniref:hypothetical protein n=1 Tax=Helicobacter sp. 12S02634-8 TaxID=1476199 RepID=UPI000BA6E814|nr:hypothetical protein [Helicobacter sp. 12S02634-8]PAF45540.1 hypothetical protein BKH46_09310 [Helicobacter sp. 12S02634-8]
MELVALGAFGTFLSIIIAIGWMVFGVLGIIYFYKIISTMKLDDDVEKHYRFLIEKDIVLYYKVYAETMSLLKKSTHKDFQKVFEIIFNKADPKLYEAFKARKYMESLQNTTREDTEEDAD